MLEAAGQFSTEVLAPLNRSGDTQGARYENGRVFAPAGFADAYRQFAAGGWNSLAADPEVGGQGMPKALETAVFEIIQSANLSFSLCPMLTQGAIEAIEKNGDARQKALYLPKLVSGEWTGTMNLTEPQAGSDLGALTTRAEPRRRRLAAHRPEDLHHLGRPRHGGQHRPPGAGPPARRAARLARHLAVHRAASGS